MPSFLGRPVPPSFGVRTLSLPPGASIPFRARDWDGAVVSVEAGELEAECTRGGRRRFAPGALLYLEGLPLRALHSTGTVGLELMAITRGPGHTGGAPPMSCARGPGPRCDDPYFEEDA